LAIFGAGFHKNRRIKFKIWEYQEKSRRYFWISSRSSPQNLFIYFWSENGEHTAVCC